MPTRTRSVPQVPLTETQTFREESAVHNLPAQITRFIGRQNELRILQDLLRQERLVTLVGSGGSGKTSLAIQSAWQALNFFADGAWLIPLVEVTSPDLFYFAISEALQLPAFSNTDSQKQIINYLRGKHILLIFDNFEQLNPSMLPALLQQAPQLTALVTTRDRLNLYGECAFDLGGLDIPQSAEPEAVAAASAGQLFLQSAQRARPGFSLTAKNSPAIQRICHLVDGIPLALELAAAWVRVMNCEQIARQIESDLDFLTATWRDQPQRRRSMRALLEHSWNMLPPQEKLILQRLSILSGRFNLPAAQAVAQVTLPELISLLDKALIHWDSQSESYTSHPLLKRYAAEHMAEKPGEQIETCKRHCQYFLNFIRQRRQAIHGPEVLQKLHEISEALNDIRLAWDWAVQNGQWEFLDLGLDGLFEFYKMEGRYAEGAVLFDTAAQAVETATNLATQTLLWRLRMRQAAFIAQSRRLDEARKILEAGLPILRTQDNPTELAFGLTYLGLTSILESKHADADTFLAEALSIARNSNLQLMEADILRNQAENCEHLGNLAAARQAIEQAEKIYHVLEDQQGKGRASYMRGWIAFQQGDYLQAQACFQRTVEIGERLGDLFGQSSGLDSLASLLRRRGYYSDAAENRRKALALIQQTGNQQGEAVVTANLGTDLLNQGDYATAQACYQRSLAIHREMGLRRNESIDLSNLANVTILSGDASTAMEYIQQGLAIAQANGDQFIMGVGFTIQGNVLYEMHKLSEANASYLQALDLMKANGQDAWVKEIRAYQARLALTQENLSIAEEFALEVWQAIQNGDTSTLDEPFLLHICCQVFQAAGDPRAGEALRLAYTRLHARAAKISDEATRRLFLENVTTHREIQRLFTIAEKEPPSSTAIPAVASEVLPDPLTRQEIEILRLLASGLSNQQIAEKLVISVGTVKFHVHNLYAKLNVQNRTQAAARGRELELV